VWRRRSVSIGGGPAHEPSFVVWVQGQPDFADVRWCLQPHEHGGLCADQAFGGWTTWEAPYLTWHHCIDRSTSVGADRGQVELDGDVLVERGTTRLSDDSPIIEYEEVWERIEGGPVSVVRSPTPAARALRIESPTLAVELEARTGDERVGARLERRRADGAWWLERELA
jgi:hypothetical protein